MKWIGQHIYDQASRFRGNVFIENSDLTIYKPINDNPATISLGSSATERLEIKANYASGTQEVNNATFKTYTGSATGNRGRFIFSVDETTILQMMDAGLNLGESKALQINGTDIITDSSGTATLSNINALDATTETTIEAAIDTLSNLTTVSSSDVEFTNTTIHKPVVEIKNTGNNASGGMLKFTLDKGAVGADNDVPGGIQWTSDNDAQQQINFGQLYTQVADATDGQEAGAMYLQVAEYDGTVTTGLKLDGDTDADGEVDVTIGSGVASTTTIAGDLTLGGQLKKRLHYIHTTFKANNDMDTERYVSLVDADREATAEDNLAIVAIMPATGVLKRVIWNTSSDLSAKSWTFKFKKIPSGTVYTSETLVATVTKQATSGMGGASTNSIIDFTTDASDADNACTFETGFSTSTQFSAGDRVLFSFESNTAPSGEPKCNLTFVFELDESTVF